MSTFKAPFTPIDNSPEKKQRNVGIQRHYKSNRPTEIYRLLYSNMNYQYPMKLKINYILGYRINEENKGRSN